MTYARIASGAHVVAPFALTSMAEISAPDGCSGTWQHYVITQGHNRIEGMRCGSHDEVSMALADVLDRLNGRFSKAPRNTAVRGRR